jgi:ComF family protein
MNDSVWERCKRGLLNLFYPAYPECPVCNSSFSPERISLCEDCLSKIKLIRDNYCPKCGKLTSDSELCCDCKDRQRFFARARAVGVYQDGLKEYIKMLKYDGHRQLAKPMGSLLSISITRFYSLAQIDLVTYIPIHSRRKKERGFNQAYLLAKRAADELDLSIKLVLKRTTQTPRQSDLSRRRRLENLTDVFTVITPKLIIGKRILLVDDIYTTGTTVNQASKTLLTAGAQSVKVITLATGKDFSY